MSERKEEYLGDAVYASFDGWNVWLRTGDGNDQRIALEPEVIAQLVGYIERLSPGFIGNQLPLAERAKDKP